MNKGIIPYIKFLRAKDQYCIDINNKNVVFYCDDYNGGSYYNRDIYSLEYDDSCFKTDLRTFNQLSRDWGKCQEEDFLLFLKNYKEDF